MEVLIDIVDVTAVPGLHTNCYLVADDETRQAVVIDPGGSPDAIVARIQALRLEVVWILNTHGHFDHIAGNGAVQSAVKADIAAHRASEPLYRARGGAGFFGIFLPAPAMPTHWLEDGDEIRFGNEALTVLHTPGHTPGCVTFWSQKHKVAFDGDLLFRAGVGRTDLPGGDFEQLLESIRNRILTLPDETVIYPGHGPETTVGEERRHNPFLQDSTRNWWI
jgi:glyoxylase-like metal-dependent hydrolase (beta-lactamase superfamily II)